MGGTKPKTRRIVGPYSAVLRRGVIGEAIDGRSTIGRLARDLEAQLVAHVGGNPSVTQRLLIERIVKIKLQLDAFDTKLATGTWQAHDQRTFNALLNAHRLACRELGMAPAPAPQPSLAEITAEIAARRGAAA
jgi:hypothetical protein